MAATSLTDNGAEAVATTEAALLQLVEDFAAKAAPKILGPRDLSLLGEVRKDFQRLLAAMEIRFRPRHEGLAMEAYWCVIDALREWFLATGESSPQAQRAHLARTVGFANLARAYMG